MSRAQIDAEIKDLLAEAEQNQVDAQGQAHAVRAPPSISETSSRQAPALKRAKCQVVRFDSGPADSPELSRLLFLSSSHLCARL